jgi:hypothetical protein
MTRKVLCALAVAVLGLAVYAGSVLATPQNKGFSGTTIATARYGPIFSHIHTVPASWSELIQTKGDSDLYVQQNTWDPAAVGCDHTCVPTTGWHTHPGPSFVIVTEGSITTYDGDDPSCTPHVYTANTPNNAFLDEGGGHVHVIRNETASIAKSVAVQLIPAGATRRQDAPDPGNCPF